MRRIVPCRENFPLFAAPPSGPRSVLSWHFQEEVTPTIPIVALVFLAVLCPTRHDFRYASPCSLPPLTAPLFPLAGPFIRDGFSGRLRMKIFIQVFDLFPFSSPLLIYLAASLVPLPLYHGTIEGQLSLVGCFFFFSRLFSFGRLFIFVTPFRMRISPSIRARVFVFSSRCPSPVFAPSLKSSEPQVLSCRLL